MATITMPVKPKRSTVAGKVPTTADLVTNEIGINYTDRKVYGRSPIDDSIVTLLGSSGSSVGEVIERPTATTPTGYLRANGGEVSQTTYSALYAVIGDAYNITIQPGNGQPWRQQHAFNTQQSTDITGWTTGTPLPSVLSHSSALVTKDRVYLLGGYDGTSEIPDVYTAPINTDGTLGTWTTGTPLPVAIAASQVLTTKGRVYLLGGQNGGGGYLSTVYTAPINADGTLGTWTTGTALPFAGSHFLAVLVKDRVYLFSDTLSTVGAGKCFSAPVDSNGIIGGWTVEPDTPIGAASSDIVVTGTRVYLFGWGVNDVSYASINPDGKLSSWVVSGTFPESGSWRRMLVTRNRVWSIGIHPAPDVFGNRVYTAPINTDGSIGTWSTSTSLPGNGTAASIVATNSRIYHIGGIIGPTSITNAVYSATFSGGLNDYSPYYNGTYVFITTPGNFRLPDYSGKEGSTGPYYFIKH